MIYKGFINLAAALLAGASPILDGPSCGAGRPKPTLPSTGSGKSYNQPILYSPRLTLTNTDQELEGPTGNLTLKHIALGFGVQNYTCSGADASPEATGALAMLYDITDLYPGQTYRSLPSVAAFEALGVTAMYDNDLPLILDAAAPTGSQGVIHQGASTSNPFPEPGQALVLGGGANSSVSHTLPFLGHHFFDAGGVPNFALSDLDLIAAKLQDVPAPKAADKGAEGTGAVDWLGLGPKDGSSGARYVYRVTTVGGSPHGCSEEGHDSTTYTAQYWFYN